MFTPLAAESDEPTVVTVLVRSLYGILDEPSQREIRRLRYYDDLEQFYVQSEELGTLIEDEPDHPASEYITRVCHENDLGTKKTGRDLVAQYLTFKAYRCSPSDSVWPSRRAKIMTQKHAGDILHTICRHFDRSVLLLLPEQSLTL